VYFKKKMMGAVKTLVRTATSSLPLDEAVRNCSDYFRRISCDKEAAAAYLSFSNSERYLIFVLQQRKGVVRNGYNTVLSVKSHSYLLNSYVAYQFEGESGIKFGPPSSGPLIMTLLDLNLPFYIIQKNHDLAMNVLRNNGI